MEESACAITALASALGVPAPPAPQQRPAEAAPSAARAPTPPPREGVGMFGALLALRPLELPLRGGDGKSAGRERVRKGEGTSARRRTNGNASNIFSYIICSSGPRIEAGSLAI